METEHEEKQEHRTVGNALEARDLHAFLAFALRLAEDDLLDKAEHVGRRENHGESHDARANRAQVPQGKQHGEFTDKARRSGNRKSHHAGSTEQETERRRLVGKPAHFVDVARARHALGNSNQVVLHAGRNTVGHQQHENCREHRLGEAEHARDRNAQVAHGTERKQFLAVARTERHQGTVDCGSKPEPHHRRNLGYVEGEHRKHPGNEPEHASLTHGTRKDSRERSRSLRIGNRLPAVERENRGLHDKRHQEAHEQHELRVFRQALHCERHGEEQRVVRNREQVPERHHHRGRTDQRVDCKRHGRFLALLAAEARNQDGSRNNHRFEEEEEQHSVGGKERTVHRTHQGKNPDGEITVVVPEEPACRDEGHERKPARKEHHPGAQTVAVEVVVRGALAAGNPEPFHRSGSDVPARDKSDGKPEEHDGEENRHAGRRPEVFLGVEDHQDGGNKRGKDKEM